MKFKLKFSPLQIVAHATAWFLVAWLVYDFFSGNMSVNPIQEITQRTGRYAIWFLVVSLACTPLNTLFGFRQALTARRALGLYAFMFASLHFLTFSGLDYAFNWQLLKGAIFEKRFVIVGLLAGIILLTLALTSTKGWQKRLGKNWTRLHKAVYAAGVLVIFHYAWAVKGDFLRLQGNVLMPLIVAFLVTFLLSLRIPPIRKWVTHLRGRIKRYRSSLRQNHPAQKAISDKLVETSKQ